MSQFTIFQQQLNGRDILNGERTQYITNRYFSGDLFPQKHKTMVVSATEKIKRHGSETAPRYQVETILMGSKVGDDYGNLTLVFTSVN